MNEKPNYYAIIPAEVRYNSNLRPSEKLLFGEITALSNATGICTASNKYFATLYDVVPSAITKWIADLVKYDYIKVEYIMSGKEIKQRIIRLSGSHKYDDVFTKVVEGYSQKAKENNTSNNNTSKKEIYKEKRFKKPTLEEVEKYCEERNNGVDPQRFIDFYESKGWLVGKSPMKDWKACVRTWERKECKDVPAWFDKKLDIEEPDDDFDSIFEGLV